jgi:hypothetical protein
MMILFLLIEKICSTGAGRKDTNYKNINNVIQKNEKNT